MYLTEKKNHVIQLTENLKFNFATNSKFVEVKSHNENHSLYVIYATELTEKIPAEGKLAEVKTKDKVKYPFEYSRLAAERGILITSQVKIVHPTPEVRLPYLGYHQTSDKSILRQLLHLPAEGGTGKYKWSSDDENVVTVRKSDKARHIGELRGNHLGDAQIVVRDALNYHNFDSIPVKVTKIGSLGWLEEKIEKIENGTEGYSYLQAFDTEGKKFTNCTSLAYSLTMRKEDAEVVRINQYRDTWAQTQSFLTENLGLIELKHRFDENSHVGYLDDLPSEYDFDSKIEVHNNFGICGADRFVTKKEGLARVKATLLLNRDKSEYEKAIESDALQIASYKLPVTVSPTYSKFFYDVYETKDEVQLTKHLSQYYKNDVYKISYGSSLYWVYNGGTNYWPDDIYEFDHRVANGDKYGLDVTRVSEHLPPLANRVTFRFDCESRGSYDRKEFDMEISMKNRVTRGLLRPKKTVAKVTVHCALPKSLNLWWAQKDDVHNGQFEPFPKAVLGDGERTYYMRNNQSKYMRVFVFDKDKQVLFNTTSLAIDFYPDKEEFLAFEDYGRNDKKLAKFSRSSGIVKANARINRDTLGYSITEITNHKRIKLIEPVSINPRFQTRYIDSENVAEFYIIDGSNSFSLKANSSDIASYTHLADKNTIETHPLKEGYIEVLVEDYGVEVPQTATAVLLVSDVAKIDLIGGGLMEEGNSMNLTIKVFDSQGHQFDYEQLRFMKFNPEVEVIAGAKVNMLEVSQVPGVYDTFRVDGVKSGSYRVTVTLKPKDPNLRRRRSNYVKVDVFNVVKIVPEEVLLFPGGRWTIQVEGGPQGGSKGSVYRDYQIEDKHICEINEYGEIHGKHVGETWLSLSLQYKNKVVLASRKIKVRVALVTSIDIPSMNERSVFVNSLTRLNVRLMHNKEVFLHAIGPLSFEWKTSTAHIYSLSLPSKKDSKGGSTSGNLMLSKTKMWNGENRVEEDFTTHFNYSSIVGVANKMGDAKVSVLMAIEYPEEYSGEKNFFYHSIKVRVNKKLTMEVPEFIENPRQEPHIYVLPPLARNKIVTNKDAKVKLAYSIQTGTHVSKGFDCQPHEEYQAYDQDSEDEDNPILKIEDSGYIETLDKYGKATVIIEENQSQDNQIVMLNVMISQIFSISIEKPYTALSLPMGSETNLKLTFQDENARSFADEIIGVEVFIQNSHPHVVKASMNYYNSTLNLNALGIGEANIKVLVKNGIFDVIRVKVLSSIIPHSPVQLHVGGTVQFMFSEEGSSLNAQWSSGDTNILTVDPGFGKATARKEGEAKVFYQGNVNLVSIVNVKKVDRIELDDKTKPEFFTNAKSNSHYRDEHQLLLNVYLEDGLGEVYPEIMINGKPLVKHNIKLTCETQDNDFAVVFARNINNRFACILRPQPDDVTISKIPNTIKILVRATSENSASYKLEETFEIPFVSFFKVNHPTSTLNFYKDKRFTSVEVISNTVFNVDVEGNSDLVIYKIVESDYDNHFRLEFSIPISVNTEFNDLKVRVSNVLTDSSHTLYLNYSNKLQRDAGVDSEPDIEPERPTKRPDGRPRKGTHYLAMLTLSMLGIIVLVLA